MISFGCIFFEQLCQELVKSLLLVGHWKSCYNNFGKFLSFFFYISFSSSYMKLLNYETTLFYTLFYSFFHLFFYSILYFSILYYFFPFHLNLQNTFLPDPLLFLIFLRKKNMPFYSAVCP